MSVPKWSYVMTCSNTGGDEEEEFQILFEVDGIGFDKILNPSQPDFYIEDPYDSPFHLGEVMLGIEEAGKLAIRRKRDFGTHYLLAAYTKKSKLTALLAFVPYHLHKTLTLEYFHSNKAALKMTGVSVTSLWSFVHPPEKKPPYDLVSFEFEAVEDSFE